MIHDDKTLSGTIGARWIATGDGPLLQHAALRIVNGVIAKVVVNGQKSADQDLGDVLITPAWVNAHTHLEFSHLPEPLGQRGMSITDWIPLVIADRVANASTSLDSIKRGLVEIKQTGTVAVGEIATRPWHRDLLDEIQGSSLLLTSFIERLGNQPDHNSAKVAEAQDWLNFDSAPKFWQGGLSPHAPYSTNFELFSQLVRHAKSAQLPLAMHLAESPEEIQFLKKGSGPFLDLLERLNAAPVEKQRRSVMDFLQALSELQHGLVIHGNYLSNDEIDFVAKHDCLHVVYCPRTHCFFEHEPYPLNEMRQRGINVAVGTDSRASNPDLDLLSELKQLATQYPNIPEQEILQIGTQNGANALGLDSWVGSLSKGKLGRIQSFPISDDLDPLNALFRG